MKKYLSKVQDAREHFKHFKITKIPREENERANQLARLGLATYEEIEASEDHV